MEDPDELTRKRNVVSRRPQASAEEMRPFLPTPSLSTPSKPSVIPPPRSGQLPSRFHIDVRDKRDASAKRRFRVNLPKPILAILVLVFVVVPLLIFFYKEVHIHENHDEAHFKPEKFINVDTHDVLSHFLDNKHQNNTKLSPEQSVSPGDDLVEVPAANLTVSIDGGIDEIGESNSIQEDGERKRHLRRYLIA
jgi:hypothetical protein